MKSFQISFHSPFNITYHRKNKNSLDIASLLASYKMSISKKNHHHCLVEEREPWSLYSTAWNLATSNLELASVLRFTIHPRVFSSSNLHSCLLRSG